MIARHQGSRRFVAWPGTQHEPSFIDLSRRDGGRLVDAPIDRPASVTHQR